MRRRTLARFLVPSCAACLLVGGTHAGGRPERSGASAPAPARMRGVCWEAVGEIEPDHLLPLRDLGVDWISQTPFGWSPSLDTPAVHLATSERVLWGESDTGLERTAAWARGLGIRTLLKPHLWVRHGAWVGDLAMRTEADWQQWFADYETFILHYARLAEAEHLEALAVGTELVRASERTADWRRLVERVREVYHGQLTYCANWHDEAERIEFWDGLDFVGIQAYYPLGSAEHPEPDSIRAAWAPVAARLASLAARTGRPIVFTEVGYKSAAGSLREPWSWTPSGVQDLDLQREAYRALFETFWNAPWFGGTFIWKWHPYVRRPDRAARDFTPQGKPALAVLRAWYRDGGEAAGRRMR